MNNRKKKKPAWRPQRRRSCTIQEREEETVWCSTCVLALRGGGGRLSLKERGCVKRSRRCRWFELFSSPVCVFIVAATQTFIKTMPHGFIKPSQGAGAKQLNRIRLLRWSFLRSRINNPVVFLGFPLTVQALWLRVELSVFSDPLKVQNVKKSRWRVCSVWPLDGIMFARKEVWTQTSSTERLISYIIIHLMFFDKDLHELNDSNIMFFL